MLKQFLDTLTHRAPELGLRVLTALLIVVVASFVGKTLARLASKALTTRRNGRAATLAPLVQTLTFATLVLTGVMMALDQLGVNVSTLIAGAGVVGLALGFGAQTLVKDCLSGFFLILDGVITAGDVIEMEQISGTVETIGLRMTQIRSYDGRLWYVPNGRVQVVANYNRGWVRAIVEVSLAYEQDINRGLSVLQRVAEAWCAENQALVLEPPEVQGLMAFDKSEVTVRLVVKMRSDSGALWAAQRELRRRVKQAFDEENVEIPFPRQVVYHRQEPTAPANLKTKDGPASDLPALAQGQALTNPKDNVAAPTD